MISKWRVQFLFLFANFALIESQCGVVKTQGGLLAGGKVSEQGKWPWVAALFNTETQNFFCGSSLISARHVLTAAHCVQDKEMTKIRSPSDVTAYFGKHNLSVLIERGSIPMYAVDILVHPDWKPFESYYDADIAAIKLNGDVTLIANIIPVCLWTGDANMNLVGKVVGWGQTENQKNEEHSDVLREVTMRPVDLIDCMRHSGPSRLVSRRTFCAGGDGSTPCVGDSGGGFFVSHNSKQFLMGIVSSAEFIISEVDYFCGTHAPGVFTDVGKFTGWIESVADLSIDKKFPQRKCTKPVQRSRRAVGGTGALPHSWPWIAAIYEKEGSNESFYGGGSLISQRHVLTSAHSIQSKRQTEPRKPDDIVVYLGLHARSAMVRNKAVRAKPKNLIIHPDWDPEDTRWDADLAIIELTTDVQLSGKIFPVCLITQQEFLLVDEGTFVGWGSTDASVGSSATDYPHELKMTFVSNDDCNRNEILGKSTSSRSFCAGGEGSGVCFGDGGSGLYTTRGSNWYLTGIASASVLTDYQECDVDNPAIFTNVAKFSTWIEETLSSNFVFDRIV